MKRIIGQEVNITRPQILQMKKDFYPYASVKSAAQFVGVAVYPTGLQHSHEGYEIFLFLRGEL
jgi:hypothetical protein